MGLGLGLGLGLGVRARVRVRVRAWLRVRVRTPNSNPNRNQAEGDAANGWTAWASLGGAYLAVSIAFNDPALSALITTALGSIKFAIDASNAEGHR